MRSLALRAARPSDEVMKKAAEHAKAAHGIDNVTPELAQRDQERVGPVQKKIC